MAQTIVFGGLCLLLYSRTVQAADHLIVPGLRVGPVTRTSTQAGLLKSLGKQAVRATVDTGEGETEPGLILYASDPARRLAVTWNQDKPSHPSIVFICYRARDNVCRWHTATGIAMGLTLKELEQRNGKPFEMVVWGSDVGGNVTDYQGGALERELRARGLALNLEPRVDDHGSYLPKLTLQESASVQGEKFVLSSDPVLQKLNPRVAVMTLQFR